MKAHVTMPTLFHHDCSASALRKIRSSHINLQQLESVQVECKGTEDLEITPAKRRVRAHAFCITPHFTAAFQNTAWLPLLQAVQEPGVLDMFEQVPWTLFSAIKPTFCSSQCRFSLENVSGVQKTSTLYKPFLQALCVLFAQFTLSLAFGKCDISHAHFQLTLSLL